MSTDTETLINELSSALADLVEVAQGAQVNGAEVSATLVDLLDVLKAHKPGESTQALCEAIRSVKPQVTVNVQPTPITVAVERGAYKFEFSYDHRDRITGGAITPVVKP